MPRITKEQAAVILGKTTRAVERYAADSKNRLSVVYEKGRTRDVPMYDEGEIRALAERLRQPSSPAQAVITTQDDNADTRQSLVAISPQQALQAALSPSDIATLATRQANTLEALQTAVSGIAERLEKPALSLADKLTLSLVEASQLSGLSRNHLRQAIEDKKLKARIIGRGWRVKRDDLDTYVRKL